MKSRTVAVSAVLAALYVVTTLYLAPISFNVFQCRLADALYPLIGLLGWPAVIGLTIGQLVANTQSPMLPWDLASPLLFFPAKILISKFGFKAVPIHVLCVALWVPVMLTTALKMPFWVSLPYVGVLLPLPFYVGVGEAVAELGVGGLVYRGLKGRI